MLHDQVSASENADKEFRRWWFKLENNVLADPRFATLSNEEFGVFVRLLAVANASEPTPGFIEDAESLAFTIRVPLEKLLPLLREFDRRDLIDFSDTGIQVLRSAMYYDGAGLTYSSSREGNKKRAQDFRDRQRESKHARNGYASRAREENIRVDKSTSDKSTSDTEEDFLAFNEEEHDYQVEDVPLLGWDPDIPLV